MALKQLGIDKLMVDKLKNQFDDIKNQVVAGKNDTEKRVYEALSNKNWGTSSTILNDIARDSYDIEKYGMIMTIIWQSLDSPGREWRKVFKALSLLEHLVKSGTERVVEDARDHLHRVKMLSEFNYYEGHVDKGSGVREKSKQLMELLKNNDSIRDERERARKLRDKYVGISNSGGQMSSASRYDGIGSDAPYGGSGGGGYDRDTYGGSSGRYSDSYTGTGGRGPARDTYSDDPPPVTSRAVEESKPAVTKQRSTGTRKKAPKPVQEESKPDNGGDLLGGGGSDGFDFDPRAGGGSGASLAVPQAQLQIAAPVGDWDAFGAAPQQQQQQFPQPPQQQQQFQQQPQQAFNAFAAPVAASNDFGAFGGQTSTTTATTGGSTDFMGAFGSAMPPAAPQQQQQLFGGAQLLGMQSGSGNAPQQQQQQQQQFGSFQSPQQQLAPQQQFGAMGGGSVGLGGGGSQHLQQQQQQPQLQQQRGSLTGGMAGLNLFSSQQSQQQPLQQLGANGTNGSSSANTADFGDFQSTTSNTSNSGNNAANNNTTAGQQQQSQQQQSAVPKKWGDVASLVELGSLRTNTEKKAAEDASTGVSERQNSAAFAGLDGFGGPAAGGLSGSAHQQPLGGMMGSFGQQQQQPQQFGGQGMMSGGFGGQMGGQFGQQQPQQQQFGNASSGMQSFGQQPAYGQGIANTGQQFGQQQYGQQGFGMQQQPQYGNANSGMQSFGQQQGGMMMPNSGFNNNQQQQQQQQQPQQGGGANSNAFSGLGTLF